MTARRVLTAGAVLALAVGAAALVLHATEPHGPGLTIDTTMYLLAAETYESGRDDVGRVLNGVFPPGYPAAVALADVVVDDVFRSAVVVNAVALAGSVLLVGRGVWASGRDRREASVGRVATRTAVGTVLAAAVVACSEPMLRWAGAAMSELLSVVLLLAAVVVAGRVAAPRSPLRWSAVGVLAGGATLVRLVAAGSVIGLGVAAFVVTAGRWTDRLRAMVTVGLAGAATVVVGTPLLAGSTESRRTVAWHPPGLDDGREGLDTVAEYLLPSSLGTTVQRVLAGGLLLAGLVLVGHVAVRLRREPDLVPRITVVAGLVALAHVGTVVASMALLDDLTPLDDRILLPALPLVVLAVGAALVAGRPAVHPAVALAVVAVVLGGQVGRVAEWTRDSRSEGIMLAHTLFSDSEAMQVVRQLPDDVPVWSNDISLLYLRADRVTMQLPSKIDGYAGRDSATYEEGLDELDRSLDDGAVVVYLDYFPSPNLPSAAELSDRIGPVEIVELSDGRVLRRAG